MSMATQSSPSWTTSEDDRITLLPGDEGPASRTRERVREAIPSPPPAEEIAAKGPSSISPRQTSEIVETLQTFVERMQTMNDTDNHGDAGSLMANVRKFARAMQQKVAKLGGISPGSESREERRSRSSIVNGDDPDRPSFSCSLDGYRPDVDVVAPISVRPNAMELLWVCGDCGEHYPRARQCPEQCKSCGAPKQNFYAPIED